VWRDQREHNEVCDSEQNHRNGATASYVVQRERDAVYVNGDGDDVMRMDMTRNDREIYGWDAKKYSAIRPENEDRTRKRDSERTRMREKENQWPRGLTDRTKWNQENIQSIKRKVELLFGKKKK